MQRAAAERRETRAEDEARVGEVGVGGFGTGVILAAALAPLIGIKAVIPVLAVAGIIINAGRFWFYRASLERRTLALVVATSLPFLVLGTWIYAALATIIARIEAALERSR